MTEIKETMKAKGIFTIQSFDELGKLIETKEFTNTIMNEGMKKLLGILNGTITDDIVLKYIELGTGTTDPVDRSRESLVTAIEDKIEITSGSIGTSYPFNVTRSVTISSSAITRPVTVKEIGVFFGPEDDEVMFARVVIEDGYVFASGSSNIITYGLYIT